jgi:hypothetical protein
LCGSTLAIEWERKEISKLKLEKNGKKRNKDKKKNKKFLQIKQKRKTNQQILYKREWSLLKTVTSQKPYKYKRKNKAKKNKKVFQ